MSAPTVLILEGLFYSRGGEVIVETSEGVKNVGRGLSLFRGRPISFSIHHLPPKPPIPGAPGFGACLWRGHCPCGHQEDPEWLYHKLGQGVLKGAPDGSWTVDEEPLFIDRHMPGHRGQIVVFAGSAGNPEASVDDLLNEAGGLLRTLEGLRTAVEGEK